MNFCPKHELRWVKSLLPSKCQGPQRDSVCMWDTLDPVESHDNPLCPFLGSYVLPAWPVTYATL
jgi:hypothetical protein